MYKTPNTVEDILENPKAFGLPTFEEFVKNNGKIRSEDAKFARIDKSSQVFRNGIRKHIYYFESYRCRSLEEVQSICAREGVSITKLDVKPQIVPDRNDPDKCDIIIKFERPLSMLLGIV